jgi:hypothetical protein
MVSKNKLLLLSFCLSTLILVIAPRKSQAAEQLLATVSTDVTTDVYHLVVDTNEDTQTLKAIYVDNVEGTNLKKRDSITIDSFVKEGAHFNNFAKIETNNFDDQQGGVIIIDAVYNILTGKRKSYDMQLAKDKTGWKLFKEGTPITQIIAHANKLPLIGVVGAKDLTMK